MSRGMPILAICPFTKSLPTGPIQWKTTLTLGTENSTGLFPRLTGWLPAVLLTYTAEKQECQRPVGGGCHHHPPQGVLPPGAGALQAGGGRGQEAGAGGADKGGPPPVQLPPQWTLPPGGLHTGQITKHSTPPSFYIHKCKILLRVYI